MQPTSSSLEWQEVADRLGRRLGRATAAYAGLRRNPASDTHWNALYRAKLDQLKWIAARRNVPRLDWTNVAQETMVNLAQHLQTPSSGSTNVHKLVGKIHSNNIGDYFRRRQNRWLKLQAEVETELGRTVEMLVPDDRNINGRDWAELQDYLGLVDAVVARVQRAARPETFHSFERCVLDGLSPEEVAREAGVDRRVVDVHVNRIRERIRTAVREELKLSATEALSTLIRRNFGHLQRVVTSPDHPAAEEQIQPSESPWQTEI